MYYSFSLIHYNCKIVIFVFFSVSGECAHVLAVIMTVTDWVLEGYKEVPAQPSCTSLPQQWDKPRGQKICPEPVSTMVIAKPGNLKRKRKPLSAVFIDNR